MKGFLENLKDPGWLLSVVVVGLVLDVVAGYLKTWIDRQLARLTERRKQKVEEQTEGFHVRMQEYLDNPQGRLVLRLDLLYFSLVELAWTTMAVAAFTFFLMFVATSGVSRSPMLTVVLASLFGLGGLVAMRAVGRWDELRLDALSMGEMVFWKPDKDDEEEIPF